MFLNFFRVLFFILLPFFKPLSLMASTILPKGRRRRRRREKKKPFLILFLKCGLGISLLCV
jgi:hypothetical protein